MNTRIIWISDLHFRESYRHPAAKLALILKRKKNELADTKKGTVTYQQLEGEISDLEKQLVQMNDTASHKARMRYLEPYIKSFINLAMSLAPRYLLITGDIACHGTADDYEAFHELFIIPLQRALPRMMVLTIPGNHDLQWSEIVSLDDLLTRNRASFQEAFLKKEKALKEKQTKFKRLFSAYSNYTQRFAKEIDEQVTVDAQSYKSNGHLYGLVVDHANRICFALLNSAWFSFGSGIHPAIIEALKNLGNTDLLHDRALASEQGGQILGSSLIDFDEKMKMHFNQHYTVVLAMHHSFSWLEWGQMHNYQSPQYVTLHRLLEHADVVLTGHEHVPVHTRPQILEDGVVHLPAGMFLVNEVTDQLHQPDESQLFQHNWFSLLETNPNSVLQTRYVYDQRTQSWNVEGEVRSFFKRMTGGRTELIAFNKLVAQKDNYNKFTDCVIKKYGFELEPTLGHSLPFSIYKGFSGENKWLLLMPRKPMSGYFYEPLITGKDSTGLLDELVRAEMPQHICFISPDWLACVPEMRYKQVNSAATQAKDATIRQFNAIVQHADQVFDVFRYKVYVRFEKSTSPENPEATALGNLFELYKNIQFANEIIPFWKVLY